LLLDVKQCSCEYHLKINGVTQLRIKLSLPDSRLDIQLLHHRAGWLRVGPLTQHNQTKQNHEAAKRNTEQGVLSVHENQSGASGLLY